MGGGGGGSPEGTALVFSSEALVPSLANEVENYLGRRRDISNIGTFFLF